MKPNRSIPAVLILVLVLAGCARAKPQGPDKTGPEAGTAFCKAATAFRDDTVNLNGQTFTSNPDQARQLLNNAADDLDKLAPLAPTAVLKDDITTVAAGFRTESKALANVTPGDVKAALNAANLYAQDKKVTAAAKDLDGWVHPNCGINTEGNPPTTVAGVTTTVPATVGPVVPASTTTTAPVTGPAAPTTSTTG
jgi:hypothetical protein